MNTSYEEIMKSLLKKARTFKDFLKSVLLSDDKVSYTVSGGTWALFSDEKRFALIKVSDKVF